MDQHLVFLEFEYVLGAAVALVALLVYLFYIKYPYDKDLD
jgi:hypothetical protein